MGRGDAGRFEGVAGSRGQGHGRRAAPRPVRPPSGTLAVPGSSLRAARLDPAGRGLGARILSELREPTRAGGVARTGPVPSMALRALRSRLGGAEAILSV